MKTNSSQYSKNYQLEHLMEEINSILAPVEEREISKFNEPKYPVIFIVGVPRSGTTLFYQWITSTDLFGYPSNFLSRFYQAPYIGAKIQRLITENNYVNEMADIRKENLHKSDMGITTGVLAPHEFWYFWRRFFPQKGIECLDESKISQVGFQEFNRSLAAIESVFDKPLVLKALMINWIITYVSINMKNVLFVYLTRHPFYNAQSLFQGRLRYYGSVNRWLSFKPKEYEYLKTLDAFKQVAGQVIFTNRAIKENLKNVEEAKWVEIGYEDFCKYPEKTFNILKNKLAFQDFVIQTGYHGQSEFKDANNIRLNDGDQASLLSAFNFFGVPVIL